jgi:hypothetical protein
MGAFTERVNAALPVDEPDYILLALVQNQPGQVCGSGCPTGQAVGNNGRCLPQAILAQAEKKTGKTDPGQVRNFESPVEVDRRLQLSAAALAGQLTTPTPSAPKARAWETGTFPAAPQPVPAVRPAATASAHGTAATVNALPSASDPLPGRMGVGAPLPPQLDGRIISPTTTSLPEVPLGLAPQRMAPGAAGTANGRTASSPARKVARAEHYAPAPQRPYQASAPRRSSSSLKSSQGVKDFFFGAGRGSF